MLFKCMNCGETSPDIDMVLNSSCTCGASRFHLVSHDEKPESSELTTKEQIRRDLHRWIDLNLESVSPEEITNLRVSFDFD